MFLKDKGEVKDLIVVGDRVLVKPKSNKEKPSQAYICHQGCKKRKAFSMVMLLR